MSSKYEMPHQTYLHPMKEHDRALLLWPGTDICQDRFSFWLKQLFYCIAYIERCPKVINEKYVKLDINFFHRKIYKMTNENVFFVVDDSFYLRFATLQTNVDANLHFFVWKSIKRIPEFLNVVRWASVIKNSEWLCRFFDCDTQYLSLHFYRMRSHKFLMLISSPSILFVIIIFGLCLSNSSCIFFISVPSNF